MTLKQWMRQQREEGRSEHKYRGQAARGTQQWLADLLRLGPGGQSLVRKWLERVSEPVTHGPRIVRLSGGKVTLEELRRVKR